jgi:mono/diheme cytochrome c family protein
MKRGALVVAVLVLASPAAFAGQAGDGLNEQQRLGRRVFAQSCGVCHLRPSLNVRTYGPLLSKAAGGDEDRMRNIILEGTTRMPAFKYYLQGDQVDAIIAYVRTIPAPAAAAAAAPAAAPPD